MSKMSFRTSGSRLGDSARPSGGKIEPVLPLPRTKQLGLRVHNFVPRPAVIVPLTPDDYATAEDYK